MSISEGRGNVCCYNNENLRGGGRGAAPCLPGAGALPTGEVLHLAGVRCIPAPWGGGGAQKALELLDVALLHLEQLFAQVLHPFILHMAVPEGAHTLGDPHGAALNHHLRQLGSGVVGEGFHGAHRLAGQLGHGSNALGLHAVVLQNQRSRAFQAAVFLPLLIQQGAKGIIFYLSPDGVNAVHPHLCCLVDVVEQVNFVHVYHLLHSMPPERKKALGVFSSVGFPVARG